jgi:hypothetical protein
MESNIRKDRLRSLKEVIPAVRRAREIGNKTDRVKAFVFATSISLVIAKLARTLNSVIGESSRSRLYPIALVLCACFLVALWIYGLARITRRIGWPSWIPILYILIVLCPVAWLGAQRLNPGADFMALFGLQLPFVIAYAVRQLQV